MPLSVLWLLANIFQEGSTISPPLATLGKACFPTTSSTWTIVQLLDFCPSGMWDRICQSNLLWSKLSVLKRHREGHKSSSLRVITGHTRVDLPLLAQGSKDRVAACVTQSATKAISWLWEGHWSSAWFYHLVCFWFCLYFYVWKV